MLSFPEVHDLTDEVRRVFEELDARRGGSCRPPVALYTPSLDVIETCEAVEVFVDLAGVGRDDFRILFKGGSLVVAGEKPAPEGPDPATAAFHVVERGFGRFARVLRLQTAVNPAAARATLQGGELRITLPRVEERRGREIAIPVEEQRTTE
jgi:HSP20 family protein